MTDFRKLGNAKRGISLADRFWQKVRKSDGCWEWIASKYTAGYGQIGVNGRMRGAHQVAWGLTNGRIPDGLCVLHRCDNRACVRPDHLFLGTKRDNTRDMDAKGRARRPHLVGSQQPNAKLNEAQVMEIRRRLRAGERRPNLAREFGVKLPCIYQIAVGRSWKHVPMEGVAQ